MLGHVNKSLEVDAKLSFLFFKIQYIWGVVGIQRILIEIRERTAMISMITMIYPNNQNECFFITLIFYIIDKITFYIKIIA